MSLVQLRPEAPFAGIAHPVERHLAKVEVASSSLVARSMTPDCASNWEFFAYKKTTNLFQDLSFFVIGVLSAPDKRSL